MLYVPSFRGAVFLLLAVADGCCGGAGASAGAGAGGGGTSSGSRADDSVAADASRVRSPAGCCWSCGGGCGGGAVMEVVGGEGMISCWGEEAGRGGGGGERMEEEGEDTLLPEASLQ